MAGLAPNKPHEFNFPDTCAVPALLRAVEDEKFLDMWVQMAFMYD